VSTTSFPDLEQSDGLARRFAFLAARYFDEPSEARTPAAKIPLENLFRMLQMFRYDAFSDEPRGGILELEGFGDPSRTEQHEEGWHLKMQAAIATALAEIFGGASKEDAVTQVQSSLSWLATSNDPPPQEVRDRTKAFLERFRAALG
jgi:hypothetical protein